MRKEKHKKEKGNEIESIYESENIVKREHYIFFKLGWLILSILTIMLIVITMEGMQLSEIVKWIIIFICTIFIFYIFPKWGLHIKIID